MITSINEFKKMNEAKSDGAIYIDDKKIPVHFNYYYNEDETLDYDRWSTCVKYSDIMDIITVKQASSSDLIPFVGKSDVNGVKYTVAAFIKKINKFGDYEAKAK